MTNEEKLAAIKAELANRAGTDAEISQALNAVDPALATTRYVDVEVGAAKGILLAAGKWPLIYLGRNTASEAQGLFITVYEALTQLQSLQMSQETMRGAITQALNGLVAAQVLDQDLCNTLLTLGTVAAERSWADVHLEGRYVSPEDIAAARAL